METFISTSDDIHGIAMRSAILANESIDRAQTLLNSYIRNYAPITDLELELVEDLAVIRWRILRATAIETGLYDLATPAAREIVAAQFDKADEMLVTSATFRELAADSALALLNRYDARLRTQFNRTRNNLLDLQANRPPQMGVPIPEITPQQMESLTDKNTEDPIEPGAGNTTPPVWGETGNRNIVEKPNPVRPPHNGRGHAPEHVCQTVRDVVVQVSEECEHAMLKALDPHPGARAAVARVLDRFIRPQNEQCSAAQPTGGPASTRKLRPQ